jgi:hypothetical protein
MATLEKAIAWLVYSSVVLGVLFLAVLYGFPNFPGWLFYSIAGGEGLWVVCAVAAARRASWAPYMAVVLALITLVLSLSQPTHYTFAETGQLVAFLIFSVGAALQVALIAAVLLHLVRARKR